MSVSMKALALLLPAPPVALAGTTGTSHVLRFSDTVAGTTLPADWKPYGMSRHRPAARMTIVRDGSDDVFSIDANAAAGAIAHPLNISAATMLSWRWKVDHSVAAADLSRKSGDDFAACVYVFFDVPRASLSWLERMKLGLASRTLGQAMPAAALCHVWDNRHAVGTITPSAYFGQVRTIVLQNGDAHAGTWQSQRRDPGADFRAAFGRAAPPVTGIALAYDTDNPRAHVKAWIGDLTLTPDAPMPAVQEPRR
jgi:hypothetical protein